MSPEIAVLEIQGQYRVHTECYRSQVAEQTVILVNGSLATTASFAQAVRNLHPQFNVVLYDPPYAGRSRPHNRHERLIGKQDEAQVLLELIGHFHADHVLSFSWGGACTLMALAHRPRTIQTAVISSFSPVINAAMHDYLERGSAYLASVDRPRIGQLINDTIGQHLPALFKRFNHRHVSSLDDHEYEQMHFHIQQMREHDLQIALHNARHIEIPVLFINGTRDDYATVSDARQFTRHVRNSRFSVIQEAGHFLEMEHKAASDETRRVLLEFLLPTQRDYRSRAAVRDTAFNAGHVLAL
ncbi:alpha/beta hydrolase [Pseudomonas sp.]|uniref:alpha/beta fold hydrolase n=1 Tax=Pseudomonas sp. TaxID=306 RepID=UPI0028A63615|nr:alpha/beta hydrolase [Pseudomonas sp.]